MLSHRKHWIVLSLWLVVGTASLALAGVEKLDLPLRHLTSPPRVLTLGTERVGIIVQTVTPPEAADYALVERHQGHVYRTYTLIPGFAATLPVAQVLPLSEQPRIKRLSLDLVVRKRLEYATPTAGVDIAHDVYGLTGWGVGVALIDSGIDDHPDIDGRVVGGYDFVKGKSDWKKNDPCGHGTNIAGIVAGDGSASSGAGVDTNHDGVPDSYPTRSFFGVARQAHLINLRILDKYGMGYVSGAIAALEWAVQHRQEAGIRVVNLSLGHPIGESYLTDPLCQACEAAWRAGLVVVVAAGNWGQTGYYTIDAPGNDPYVITVGAMNTMKTVEAADDVMCTYSGKSPTRIDHILKPDLVAPGNRIISLRSKNSFLEQLYGVTNLVPLDYYWHSPLPQQKTGYFQLSGTSMSCAVVSGTVALMLEDQPNLNPDTVKARLMASSDEEVFNPDGTPADLFTRGAGYLNVPAALDQTGVIASPNWAYSSVVVRLDGPAGLFMLCEPPGGPGPPQNPPPPPPPGNPPPPPPPPPVPPPGSILWGESMDWSYAGVYGGNTTWYSSNYVQNPQDPIPPQPTSILWGEQSLWEDDASWQDDDVWEASVVLVDTFGRAITGEKQRGRSGRWDHDTDPRGRYRND